MEQMNFDIQFWKQCCSVMHDWRNFNNVSFESIMAILYDEGMTTVIHPGTWSQHPFVSGVCFFLLDALYTCNRDSERLMINATTRERRFRKAFAKAFWLWVLKRVSTLGKGDKCTQSSQSGDPLCHFPLILQNAWLLPRPLCYDKSERTVVLKMST